MQPRRRSRGRPRRGLTRRCPLRQARDLDIDAKPRSDQPTRFAFQKLTVEQTKARAGESLSRVVGNVADYSNKKYWTQAQNEVRTPKPMPELACNPAVAPRRGARTPDARPATARAARKPAAARAALLGCRPARV